MVGNIVTKILNQYFDGNYGRMARLFGVSPMAVHKWEVDGEFPAKRGRTQQAHELTGIDHKTLTPSIYKSPEGFETRLREFRRVE